MGDNGVTSVSSAKENDLEIIVDAAPSINYVNWQAEKNQKVTHGVNRQNGFSFLRKIQINNKGINDVFNTVLDITFLPECIHCDPIALTCLEKGKTTVVDTSINIVVDPQYLYGLNESINGSMSFVIKDKDGVVLTSKSQDIRVLPIEESASQGRIPTVLASFVTPHDDLVLEVKKQAAALKGASTGNPSFDGYQAEDVNDVLQQIEAIWQALQAVGITYSNPPASFEKTFQRIRLPRTVLSEKFATCIDFSLLFCSVLEAVDLHPFLISVEGHAFCGCWLVEDSSPDSLIDNSTFLMNRVAEGTRTIAVYNPTDLAKGSEVSPMQAAENALYALNNKPFNYALDIYTCRAEGILPIPTPHTINGITSINFNESFVSNFKKEHIGSVERGTISGGCATKSKFDVWEEKLLDLNMRNSLINMRLGGSAVQLLTTNVVDFFDRLQKKPKIGLFPLKSEPVHDSRFLAYESSKSLWEEKEKDLLSKNLVTALSANGEPELNIVSLARKSNTEIEESGCNPLYLAIGAIRWFDTEKAAIGGKSSLFSPILLIPASMPRRRTGPYFQVELNFEGIQFNTTLFEYFKQFLDLDFSEFNNLFSEKTEVIDIQKIYNTIRQKIDSKRGWDVMDNFMSLSLFSFAHFVMWTDMKNYREEFLKNAIVSSFVDGRKEWKDNPFEVSVNDLDNKVKPTDVAIPLPADSSQIKAIESSYQGESFILDGPPGTGKSQTIANMITNFLFHGKKVLFVAEKEVALEVVKARLDKLGLGHFCLQVHSAKANKKDVLEQIKDAWAIGSVQSPSEYAEKAEKIEEERRQLNATLNNLHKAQGYFLSVYDSILGFLRLESYKNKTVVSKEYAKSLNCASFEETKKAIEELSQYSKVVGGYANNPLGFFEDRNYSLERRDQLFAMLEKLVPKAVEFSKTIESFFLNNQLDLPTNPKNVELLLQILNELKEKMAIDYSRLDNDDYLAGQKDLLTCLTSCLAYADSKETLEKTLSPDALSLNDGLLLQTLDAADRSFFIKRIALTHRVYHDLCAYQVVPKAVKKKELRNLLKGLADAKAKKAAIVSNNPLVSLTLAGEAEKPSKDILADEEKLKNTTKIAEEIRRFIPFENKDIASVERYFVSFGDHPEKLLANNVFAFLQQGNSFFAEIDKLKQLYSFNFFYGRCGNHYFSEAADSLAQVIAKKEELSGWVEFLHRLDVSKAKAPQEFLEQYCHGEIKEEDLLPSFENALYYRIIVGGLEESGLSSLTSLSVDQQIAFYQQDIEHFAALSVEETAARVTASYPESNIQFAESTMPYQLSHFCENGGRGISLRGLFDSYGKLIQTLCPCFLMSPLSVSQYLHPDGHTFDAVIFDESSQIPTSEAIGAIARGQSVIIAGDNNQMPPTNFFASSLSSDDSDEGSVTDDLESLLDDAIAMQLPRIRLNCHYRSNHESLIAFSNNKFYENSLMTFPSPSNQVSRVSFHYMENGNYEMGRGINKPEAMAIVQEIVRRLKDSLLQKKSIGVITFNEKQQDLIDDLLTKEFDSDSSLEQNPGGENIFIKNLENVQGDERDVILFSICFGPCGKEHRMPLNFGPLSREGGQRRLNVAVSRARDEMIVYATCQPDDIRASEAKNQGAEYLRSFLFYAKNGVKTLTNSLEDHIFLPPYSVANFLAKDLAAKGYQVDLNVGSSSFRVDIGIKDPSNPHRYILGIICDANSYVDSATCRDRNIVEPTMLARLQWTIVHVWSVEYFDHHDLVVQRIISAITNPLSAPVVELKNAPIVYPIQFHKAVPSAIPYLNQKTYMVPKYPSLSYDGFLDNIVKQILESESPLSNSLLEKRIRTIYSIGRIGNLIEDTLKQTLTNVHADGERYLDEIYWWRSEEETKKYTSFRVGGDRNIVDIPYQEIANAAMDILSVQGAMSEEDLIKTIVHVFGGLSVTDRAGTHVKKCLLAAMKCNFGKFFIEDYLYKIRSAN